MRNVLRAVPAIVLCITLIKVASSSFRWLASIVVGDSFLAGVSRSVESIQRCVVALADLFDAVRRFLDGSFGL